MPPDVGNGPSPPIMPGLSRILHPNFHEKAIFVKGDVATATTVHVGYPCHASIRTFGEPAPCWLGAL